MRQVDPAELSPGEFSHAVRHAVENQGVRMLIIDSLNGYLMAMPDERFLVNQLHELLSYLSERAVATLVVLAQHGTVGSMMPVPVDLSYLADSVLLLRYYEAEGRLHKAISVVKKRSGAHENAIREFKMSSKGLSVGAALEQYRGVLSGIPSFEGMNAPLMREK